MDKSSRTKMKSFRLEESLCATLSNHVRRLRTTESAYITEVLTKQLRFDPLVSFIDGITLSKHTFRSILGETNQVGLEIAGAETAKENLPFVLELFDASGNKLSLFKFMKDILSESCGWFRFEDDIVEDSSTITLFHDYGLKWSLFLRGYLLEAFNEVSNDRADILITNRSVKICKRETLK